MKLVFIGFHSFIRMVHELDFLVLTCLSLPQQSMTRDLEDSHWPLDRDPYHL